MALSNPPSFTKILYDHNAPYLALPDDFVMKNMGDKIPEKVVIRSATGGYWWSVKVKKIDGRVSFDKGWTKVLKEAHLCYEDTLFFWLVGETTFKMWIYGTNGCEKVLPPKVHVKVEEVVVLSDEDGGHVDGSDGDDGDDGDGSDGDDGDGVHVDGMNGDDGDGVHVDGMNGDEDGSEGGGDEDGSDSDYHYDGESEGDDAGSGADGSDADHDAGSNGSDEGGAGGGGGGAAGADGSGSGGGGAGSGGGSGGADDVGSNGSGGGAGGDSDGDRYFTVTLSESHKRCLGLPSHFNGLPGIRHKEEIILKNLDGDEWEMGVTFRSNQYYLSRGWIAFTRDNKLEEGDECGFLFIKKEGKMCLTRVTNEHQNPPPREPKVV